MTPPGNAWGITEVSAAEAGWVEGSEWGGNAEMVANG